MSPGLAPRCKTVLARCLEKCSLSDGCHHRWPGAIAFTRIFAQAPGLWFASNPIAPIRKRIGHKFGRQFTHPLVNHVHNQPTGNRLAALSVIVSGIARANACDNMNGARRFDPICDPTILLLRFYGVIFKDRGIVDQHS